MDAAVKKAEEFSSVEELMLDMGARGRAASQIIALASPETKNLALTEMAQALRARSAEILTANEIDISAAREVGKPASFIDRLKLDGDRIEGIASSIEAIRELDDPIGDVLAEWDRPNGLKIQRVRVPLGVIGIIYESRPNVTADAGALSLKSGNAVILRGGSDSFHTSAVIHAAMVDGLHAASLPEAAIQLIPTTDRDAVGHLLKGLDGTVDVIVPRGGKSLVARVQEEARVPVFAHLDGICHVYVDGGAEADMAIDVALNAKMRRTGICGAAETLLVDRSVADTQLAPIVGALIDAGCEVRGDEITQASDARVNRATSEDWDTEYLDAIISVRVVDGVEAAIDHINRHGSHHTDSIVTSDASAAHKFLERVDSAIVLHNASTQYADGGEFGMGAEIGIATGRMHARGPVGVEQLTSFKYVVRGTGQTRPA